MRRETREVRIDMDDVQRTMQTEHQEYVDRRRKIQGDIQIRNERIEEAIDDLKDHIDKFSQAIGTNQKALKVMQETQMLEHLLSAQELEDRKQIEIMGFKTKSQLVGSSSTNFMSKHARRLSETLCDNHKLETNADVPINGGVFLDKNCISCSGNSQVLL